MNQKNKDTSFESDFGEILHHHSQTLGTLFQGLESVIDYLGESSIEGEVPPDEVDAILARPVALLLSSIERIFQSVGGSWAERGISASFKRALEEMREALKNYLNKPPENK